MLKILNFNSLGFSAADGNMYGNLFSIYIPRRKSGIYWIQVRRAAAAVEISLWTR